MCTVRLRHNDKAVKCTVFVVPGGIPVLLGIPDIELLETHAITSEVNGDLHKRRVFTNKNVGIQ